MEKASRAKAPEINNKITEFIEQAGKTKNQLAAQLDVLNNTLRVWFSSGVFPIEFKEALANFVGRPVEEIEAIGFRFFKTNLPRYRFNPNQVGSKNSIHKELFDDIEESDVLHLIIVLHKLIMQGYLENISRDEFIYLSVLEKKNKKPLSSDNVRKELLKIRSLKRAGK